DTGIDEPLYIVLDADITDHGQTIRRLGYVFEPDPVDVGQYERPPLVRQPNRSCSTDAVACPGDDDDLSFAFCHLHLAAAELNRNRPVGRELCTGWEVHLKRPRTIVLMLAAQSPSTYLVLKKALIFRMAESAQPVESEGQARNRGIGPTFKSATRRRASAGRTQGRCNEKQPERSVPRTVVPWHGAVRDDQCQGPRVRRQASAAL